MVYLSVDLYIVFVCLRPFFRQHAVVGKIHKSAINEDASQPKIVYTSKNAISRNRYASAESPRHFTAFDAASIEYVLQLGLRSICTTTFVSEFHKRIIKYNVQHSRQWWIGQMGPHRRDTRKWSDDYITRTRTF